VTSEIREVMTMSIEVQQALEKELEVEDYRKVHLPYGSIWVPKECGEDWPSDGAVCVTVYQRLPERTSDTKGRSLYGVGSCTYWSSGISPRHWTYEKLYVSKLWSADAASCEAVAVALEHRLPVCIEAPTVWHALGDAALRPPAEGPKNTREEGHS
jgi:hypothetical protein